MKTNKIYIESVIGELIDKITILEIKRKKISNKNSLSSINKEYSVLKKILKKNIKVSKQLKNQWNLLKQTNLKIWEMEDQKRLTQKHLEKLSQLAKNVYKFNDRRAEIKQKINKITGSNLREIKKYAKY
jgi:predicted outer membrane protein|tara:strand:+ start:1218 stop:1604 length:387 start_codon:yes stop_codon:yes gene_type:complete